MANEGLVWDSLLKMVHNPCGDCYPGRGPHPIYIYIYLEPKWGPLFWLECRPCFGGLGPFKNRGQLGSRYIYHWIPLHLHIIICSLPEKPSFSGSMLGFSKVVPKRFERAIQTSPNVILLKRREKH